MEVILEEPVTVITEADDREFEENVATVGLVLENMLDEISMYEKVQSEGEMDDLTSEFVYKTIADRNETYGLGEPEFSMEAFKQAPLKYSKESISSFLSSVWEKIKEIFAKILDYLTGKWNKKSITATAEKKKRDLNLREVELKNAAKASENPSISPEEKERIDKIFVQSPKILSKIKGCDPQLFNNYPIGPVTIKHMEYLIVLYKRLCVQVEGLFAAVLEDLTFIQDHSDKLASGEVSFSNRPHWKTTSYIQDNFDREKVPAGAKKALSPHKELDTRRIRVQKGFLYGEVIIFYVDLHPLSMYEGHIFTLNEEYDGAKPMAVEVAGLNQLSELFYPAAKLAQDIAKTTSKLTDNIDTCKRSVESIEKYFDEVLKSGNDNMHNVRLALGSLKDIQSLLRFTGRLASFTDSHAKHLNDAIAKYPCKL